MTGSHGGSCVPDRDIPRYVRLVEAGKLTLDDIITHEVSLDEINYGIGLVRKGEALRVVVNMTGTA